MLFIINCKKIIVLFQKNIANDCKKNKKKVAEKFNNLFLKRKYRKKIKIIR